MSFFNLIASLEKERTEKMITYYYEIDSIRFSKKKSGIFSIDLELFNDSIDFFNDYIGSAMLYNLDHRIEVIRANKNSLPLKDWCRSIWHNSSQSDLATLS